MTHEEIADAVLAVLVTTGDTTLGTISHRIHVSCPVLIDILQENKANFWYIRKAPLKETSVGLTSMGMAKASEVK